MTTTDKLVLVIGVGLIAFLIMFTCLLEEKSCYKKALLLNLQGNTTFWEGCVVKKDGNWIPIENIKY